MTRPYRLLAALAALNVLGYVDRQLVAALAPLLMADLGLSRAQVGLLIGVAFITVFALSTIAMAVLADRRSRTRLVAAGLALWSAATAFTGTASSFASLALWRALVGVGEGTLAPAALAMLGDSFPPARLGLANGVFYAGVPVGFALSFALAGWLAPWLGWRACFVVLGVAGLAAVALVWRMADPPRRAARAGGSDGARDRLRGGDTAQHQQLAGDGGRTAPHQQVAGGAGRAVPHEPALAVAGGGPWTRVRVALATEPSLALLILGAAALAYTSASSQLGITWLVQERGFAYPRAAWLSALVIATTGLAGNLGIGALTDRARRSGPGARLQALVAIGALSLLLAAGFYSAPAGSALFFACWLGAQGFLLGWFGPLLAAVQELAPAESRATLIGFTLLAVNLLGVAVGPWVTGVIGDHASLTRGLLVSVGVGAAGLLLLLAASLRGRARS